MQPSGATRRTAVGFILGAPLLGACSSVQQSISQFTSPSPEAPAGSQQQPQAVGTGQVKVGLILPLSAAGNAGVAALSMKNAAEMALAEFQNPNIQLLIKDDGGTPQGAGQSAQQAISEGAEIILGPLFATSVPATAQLTRARGISVIAFSTDSSVAGRGVYLLSFLPESDVNRIVDYAAGTGKRSFAALVPDNAYGNVVEAAFKQAAGRKGRVVAFEKYGADRATPARAVAQSLAQADALLLADDGDSVVATRGRADGRGREFAQHPAARHRSVGQSARVRRVLPCRAASMPRRIRPASAISPAATGRSMAANRCVPRPSPMMRSRWSRRWRGRKARSASRRRRSPIRPALPASMACSASAPTAPTSAALR